MATDLAYARPSADERASGLSIGLLGHGFMGRAHTNAFTSIPHNFGPDIPAPVRAVLAGRRADAVRLAAARFGFESYTADWRTIMDDDRIDVFDNAAADAVHFEPTLAAIQAGKHVMCEKPLCLEPNQARSLHRAAVDAGVKHLTCFNYRFLPAVRLAHDLLHSGELGEVYQARFRYSQQWRLGPDDEMPSGTGATHIVGCHAIDQARFLVGEIDRVCAVTASPVSRDRRWRGHPVDPVDTVLSLAEFTNGAIATIDASLVAVGRRNMLAWEVNASRGSVTWDLEDLNVLHVHQPGGGRTSGGTRVLACEPDHALARPWWPSGHALGWEHGHVNMVAHFLRAIARDEDVAPYGATFLDGWRAAVIGAAVERSAASQEWVSARDRSDDIHGRR